MVKHKFLGITIYTTYEGGHAWVIDRTLEMKQDKQKYGSGGSNYGVEVLNHQLVYCNWGWDGDKNGYYYSGAFDASNEGGPVDDIGMSRAAEEEDLEFSGTQYNYQYDIGMIPFISK